MPIDAIAQQRVDTVLAMKEEQGKKLPAIDSRVLQIVREALPEEKVAEKINCDIRGKVEEIKADEKLLKELRQKPGRAIATGIIVTALVVGSIALAILSYIGIVPAMLTYVGIGGAAILNLIFGVKAEQKFGLLPPRQPSYGVGNLFVGSHRYLINSFARRKELAKLIETGKSDLAERINTFEKLHQDHPDLVKKIEKKFEENLKAFRENLTEESLQNSGVLGYALSKFQGGKAFLEGLPHA